MAIDIGSGAILRDNRSYATAYTLVEKSNPANAGGTIDTVEIWAYSNMTGCIAGTFYTTGVNQLKCRDSENIGNVTAGSKQTFTGKNIDVVTNDYIGVYFGTGDIWYDTDTGGLDVWYKSGQYIDPNDEATYDVMSNWAISLYGTGTEAGGVAWTKSLADSLGITDTPRKAFGGYKVESVAIADLPRKASGLSKSDAMVITEVLTKAMGLVKVETMTIAETLSKAIGLAKVEAVTIADNLGKAMAYIRTLVDNLAIADNISLTLTHFLNLFDTVSISDSIDGLISRHARIAISRLSKSVMAIGRMGIARLPVVRHFIGGTHDSHL